MELKKIRALADLMNEAGLEELRLEEGSDTLCLKRSVVAATTLSIEQTPREDKTPAAGKAAATQALKPSEISKAGRSEDSDLITITSPMVGVFYSSPSPTEPPFVAVGEEVQAGQVICIIEAMKLMNEITAEQDGVITEVFPEDGQLIDFEHKLFQMRPKG